jgi:hypothetical protein
MSTEEWDDLESRARAAALGPWHACGEDRDGGSSVCSCRQVWCTPSDALVCVALTASDESYTAGEGFTEETANANARFIAAADPTTVLSLLQRIRELEQRLREEINGYDI